MPTEGTSNQLEYESSLRVEASGGLPSEAFSLKKRGTCRQNSALNTGRNLGIASWTYSWIERPCHNRHTARTNLRPATSVSERGASGSVSKPGIVALML